MYQGQTYTELKAVFKNISDVMLELGQHAGVKGGLPRDLCFHMGHNAQVSRDRGKPWPEIDYDFLMLMVALRRAASQIDWIFDDICKWLDEVYGPYWVVETGME